MEVRAISLVLLGSLVSGGAVATSLRPYGSSAPLRTLALAERPDSERDAAPLLRLVSPRKPDTALTAPAIAPLHTLPSMPASPALPLVRTGGSSFNLEGARAGDGNASGAVGMHQYVQLADGMMSVYRKEDGALLLGPAPVGSTFSDAPAGPGPDACRAAPGADAAVHFDQIAKRWVITHRAWPRGRATSGPYYQCIAVSANFDATGRYYRYVLEMQSARGQTLYFDDPHMALWPDAYYFSFNLFDSAAGEYLGARICGVERQALLRGTDALLRCHDLAKAYAAPVPVSLEGYAAAPRGASPALFLALDFSQAGRGQRLLLWRFSFSAKRLEGPLPMAVAAYVIACPDGSACVDQPAPGARLAALGDRLLPRPVYRNDEDRDTLLASHAVHMPDGQLGLRWYEIRDPLGVPRVYQQGNLSPDGASRWMGSIGMDKVGNIALAYNVAAPDTPPGIRYTGRQRSDPPGRMQVEEVIFNGNGVQSDPARAAPSGGALALDPIDGCTFWYTQRYLPSTGQANWRTRIASFKFEACH